MDSLTKYINAKESAGRLKRVTRYMFVSFYGRVISGDLYFFDLLVFFMGYRKIEGLEKWRGKKSS